MTIADQCIRSGGAGTGDLDRTPAPGFFKAYLLGALAGVAVIVSLACCGCNRDGLNTENVGSQNITVRPTFQQDEILVAHVSFIVDRLAVGNAGLNVRQIAQVIEEELERPEGFTLGDIDSLAIGEHARSMAVRSFGRWSITFRKMLRDDIAAQQDRYDPPSAAHVSFIANSSALTEAGIGPKHLLKVIDNMAKRTEGFNLADIKSLAIIAGERKVPMQSLGRWDIRFTRIASPD